MPRMNRLTLVLPLMLTASVTHGAPPQLTIYNSGFALVRQSVSLDLRAGENVVRSADVTRQIDPGSVILRDPTGNTPFSISEQKFSGDSLSKDRMLMRFEGQTIPFRVTDPSGTKTVNGRVIRGPSVGIEPIIEMDGRYLFELPGAPIFPSLPDAAALRPELTWKISVKDAAKVDAELVFLTGGLNWEADYNAITEESGNITEFTGWITIKNSVGAHFDEAKVKVVAGEINRSGPVESTASAYSVTSGSATTAEEAGPSSRAELRSLDEYHEYMLPSPVTLRDGETAQVEFVRARDLKARRSFIYEGDYFNPASLRVNSAILDPQWLTQSDTNVAIVYEFKNDAEHHLGNPLPGGRIHFYRPDQDGQLQFAGDASLNNTAANEKIKLTTGNAFDLAAERKQTQFQINDADRTATESFEIKLRNHRKDKAEIRVREHVARWRQWDITAQSIPSKKIDQYTIEFIVPVAPEEEKVLTYTVRYKALPVRRPPASGPATSE